MSQETDGKASGRPAKSLLESQGPRGDYAAKNRPASLMEPAMDLATHPRPWTKLPRKRRTKLAVMGLGREHLEAGDANYKRCMELANKWRKVRTREFADIHGYVSSGASALLASASLALAGSRFLYEKAAASGDADLIRKASALAGDARQAELAAWELAAREGMAKRKLDAANITAPWIVTDGKQKPGRKTNAERQQRDSLPRLPEKPVITVDAVLADVEAAPEASPEPDGPGHLWEQPENG